ncbi:MAG: hypothetical protein ACLGQU_04380 [Acidobacteriota bacterium]
MTQNGLDFSDRSAVEKFLKTKRFRRCANLECLPAHTGEVVLHLPVCSAGYFERQGNARHFRMPDPQRDLRPLTYMTVAIWGTARELPAQLQSLSESNRSKASEGYKRLASWLFENLVKPTEILWAAFWAWLFR